MQYSTLPVKALIHDRTKKGHLICKGCGEQIETVEHVLLLCTRAQEVWKMAPIHWDGAAEQIGNFKHWWWTITEAASRNNGMDHLALTANILWQLWKTRNACVFNDKLRHPMKTVQTAQAE